MLTHIMSASILALVGVSVGCGGRSPSGPTPASTERTPPAVFLAAPSIFAIHPIMGATEGTTPVLISGTRFQPGAIVNIGGTPATITAITDAAITATTGVGAAGRVDVVVTNPDGQSSRLSGGYTYAVVPTGPPPSITAISPNLGIAGGGTYVAISGTGLHFGTAVTIGGAAMAASARDGSLYLRTTAHSAGPVDVVVTNPDGKGATLAGGYIYALPESLDLNGHWEGKAGPHGDFTLRFTIEKNVLTSVSCAGTVDVAFSPPPSTSSGELVVAENGGVVMEGRFFSAGYGSGSINIGICTRTEWEAWKR
jgi:hypothetical protein